MFAHLNVLVQFVEGLDLCVFVSLNSYANVCFRCAFLVYVPLRRVALFQVVHFLCDSFSDGADFVCCASDPSLDEGFSCVFDYVLCVPVQNGAFYVHIKSPTKRPRRAHWLDGL